jgi:hypothetical protein
VIFRQSVRAPLAATLLLLLSAAGVFLAGIAGKLPAVVSGLGGSSLLLFSAFSAVMLRRAHSPANWLLACDGRRVLINFRSYLNAAFPAGVPHVLEILLADVEAVRATHSELRRQDSAGETLREHLLFLDVRLKPGVDLLARIIHERSVGFYFARGKTDEHAENAAFSLHHLLECSKCAFPLFICETRLRE